MDYYNPNGNNAQQYYANAQWEAYYRLKRDEERRSLITTGVLFGAAIISYLVIQTIIVAVLMYSPFYEKYQNSAVFQNCFNVLAVHMSSMLVPFGLLALIKKKSFEGKPLVPLKKLGFVKTAAWVSLGMGCCLAANFVTNFVIILFRQGGYELSQPEMLKTDSPLACITLIVATAIVPAIFEEFAFRCCALGVLRRYGKGFSVVAVSIVFGLIHGNLIQFIFAFIIGLILGYITVHTDSVLPAMLIHGFNNGLSVIQEIAEYLGSAEAGELITGAIFFVWGALAVIGLIYLCIKKQFKRESKPVSEPFALSFGAKLLCLLPGLALPIIILIILTMQFVKPI